MLAIINELLGMPPAASEHAPLIDNMLEFCHWFMLILFVGWTTFFIYVLFRFHKSRQPKAIYERGHSHLSTHIEVGVVMIEAVLLLGFALPIWSTRVNEFPKKGATLIRVYAQQFAWTFWYPGPDGIYGKRSNYLISGANQIGLDRAHDPAAKDDIVMTNSMRVPIDRPVILEITSKDVIHNFALVHMRIAHDAIPGTIVPIWFTPNKLGDYEVICGQLCGSGHYSMKAVLTVEPQADFDAWMKTFVPKTASPTVSVPVPAAATVSTVVPAAKTL